MISHESGCSRGKLYTRSFQGLVEILSFSRPNPEHDRMNDYLKSFGLSLAPSKSNCAGGGMPRQPSPSRWRYATCLIPISTFGLGVWQLYRHRWKQNLIKLREENLGKTPIQMNPDMFDQKFDFIALSEKYRYTPIEAHGHFLHEEELYVVPRIYQGKNGLHVITPFEIDEKTRILVNRGWVPSDKKMPCERERGQVDGMVSVIGTLQPICPKRLLMPENNPALKQWYWADVQEMARYTGSKPIMLNAMKTPGNPGGLPIGGQAQEPLSDNHLNYAMTWFMLSAITTITSSILITGKNFAFKRRHWI